MYADDTGGILEELAYIGLFFREFKRWGSVSGASLNEDKTKILAFNSKYEDYKKLRFEQFKNVRDNLIKKV